MKPKPLLITMSIVAVLLFLAIRGCQRNKGELAATNEYLRLTERKFEMFKTESGLNAAMAAQSIVSLNALLLAENKEVSRLEKELKLKRKTINEVTYITLEGKDSVVLVRDSFYYESTPDGPARPVPFVYKDRWNSFVASFDGDNIGLEYSISDSLVIVTTKEKGGTVVRALSSNPAIKITGLSSKTIEDKKVGRIGIGPTLTLGYTDKIVVVPGIGLQYSLIRL
jgi:hypothetical protein